MKKLSLFFSSLLLMCVISCKPDCEFGSLQNGVCVCLQGYEGEACDVESRTKYYGSWSGTLTDCTIDLIAGQVYEVDDTEITMEISENATDAITVSVEITNNNGTATIDSDNIILNQVTLSLEEMGQMVDVQLSGEGSLTSETEMEIDVTIGAFGFEGICPLTLTKG